MGEGRKLGESYGPACQVTRHYKGVGGLDSTRGSPVRDFLAKEEEQAQEARWNNELTFHAKVGAAQADPAPE